MTPNQTLATEGQEGRAEERVPALTKQIRELRFSLKRLRYNSLELDGQLRAQEHRNWEMGVRLGELQAEADLLRSERDYFRDESRRYAGTLQGALAENADMLNRLQSRHHRVADWFHAKVRALPVVGPLARRALRLARSLRRGESPG